MQKIVYEKHEELIPADKYLCDINETLVCEGLSAKTIDESQYKDISEEEAEEIIKRLGKEET